MKESLKIIFGFMKKEFLLITRDRVMKMLLLVAPVVQLSIFGYAISNEFKNIKLAFLYQPGDVMSRQLSDRIYSSKWFLPVYENNKDADEIIHSGEVDAVLVAQEDGLTKAFGRNEAKLQLLIDASNATKARAIENYINSIVRQFAFEMNPALNKDPPVTFDTRILYNPTMETSYYMVPGVMTMLIVLVTIILTSMSLAKEKEMGTFETIISAPLKDIEIILGKIVPFIILGVVDALIVISAGVVLFDVPVRGSILLLFAATVIFVAATVCIGTLISIFSHTQQQAMMGSFLFIFPANLLSGIMFPIDNMPPVLRIFAYFDPLTYYLKILRNIMLKGANPELVWMNMGILAFMTLIIMVITIKRFHQTLD